jgi:hypothetical protein
MRGGAKGRVHPASSGGGDRVRGGGAVGVAGSVASPSDDGRDDSSLPLEPTGKRPKVSDGNSAASASPAVAAAAGVRVMTWNIAAINNNPFEYWIEHPDPAYNEMMAAVGACIADPAAHSAIDVPLGEIFTDAMWEELKAHMLGAGACPAAHVATVDALWREDLRSRKVISGFLIDGSLGKKRLASMPDRLTNTIDAADGTKHARPSIINCYSGPMGSVEVWWPAWQDFIFVSSIELKRKGRVRPCELLKPISRKKYPALSEEEELISPPLQMLCLALFDVALLTIVGRVAPAWEVRRRPRPHPVRAMRASVSALRPSTSLLPPSFSSPDAARAARARAERAEA